MDDITKKDLKFTASLFFTIAFHVILWKLIEIYLHLGSGQKRSGSRSGYSSPS